MSIKDWSTTPSSNNMATPNGAPEGMAASAVNDVIRQHMADHRTQWESAQWFDYGHVVTKVDSDTFTVPGDQTAIYDAGRRLKFTGSVSGYATISSSSYSAPNTTVNVTAAAWTGTLTAVAVGILSKSNSSLPAAGMSMLDSGYLVRSESATLTANRTVTFPDSSGTVLLDSTLESAMIAFSGMYSVIKSSDESRSLTTTYADDSELVITNVPSGTYEITARVLFRQSAAGGVGIKAAVAASGTFSATVCRLGYINFATYSGTAGNVSVSPFPIASASVVIDSAINNDHATASGVIVISGTQDISVQWAQITSSATTTTMAAGSHIILRRVA